MPTFVAFLLQGHPHVRRTAPHLLDLQVQRPNHCGGQPHVLHSGTCALLACVFVAARNSQLLLQGTHVLPARVADGVLFCLQEVNEAFDELEEGNEEALKTEYERQVRLCAAVWETSLLAVLS